RMVLLGGAFASFHRGHLDMGDAATMALNLSRMYVITANIPPHRSAPVASCFHRFAMTAMAVADRPNWRASDLELRTSSPSYTSTTLRQFHERQYAPCEPFFPIRAHAFPPIPA